MWLPLTSRTAPGVRTPELAVEEAAHPWAGGVHEHARFDLGVVVPGRELQPPAIAVATAADAARARQDARAVLGRAARVQHDETGVVDPAVRVDEPAPEIRLQTGAVPAGAQGDAAGAGERRLAAEPVVEEEPGADHPSRPQMRLVRQHELERRDDVRGDPQQHLALGERLGDERGTRTARDSAGRRGSAWCSPTRWRRRGRPARRARPGGRGRPRRGRCRRR